MADDARGGVAAPEGGAHALDFAGRIGRIALRYKADIVMLDLDHPNSLPLNDPVNQLVHTEEARRLRA
jgi:guanine deaminase